MRVPLQLYAPSTRAATVPPGPAERATRAVGHAERALRRYRRDLDLMTGTVSPSTNDLDDAVILARLEASRDPGGEIADRRLRIKTLEAMIALLREPYVVSGNT